VWLRSVRCGAVRCGAVGLRSGACSSAGARLVDRPRGGCRSFLRWCHGVLRQFAVGEVNHRGGHAVPGPGGVGAENPVTSCDLQILVEKAVEPVSS
jgi:hypothetical protein